MEITAQELSNHLKELTKFIKTNKPRLLTDAKKMKLLEDCGGYIDVAKKEKKKKNKKFKLGDIVYFANLRGKVIRQNNDDSDVSLLIEFDNHNFLFTKDGRFYPEMPILISHFPYELKKKKI